LVLALGVDQFGRQGIFSSIRGLDGAGEGGRSWPSRSICEKALPRALSLPDGPGGVDILMFGLRAASVVFDGGDGRSID
jgi:hypothetical protein